MISFMKKGKVPKLVPWVKGYGGTVSYARNDERALVFSTSFGLTVEQSKVYLTAAPQGWNRERVVNLLEKLLENKAEWLNGYTDRSSQTFKIELHLKRGVKPKAENMPGLMDVLTNETCAYNMITTDGRLEELMPEEVVRRFVAFRKKHLIRRFKRLGLIEKDKIDRNTELIRFIREGWNRKVVDIKGKAELEKKLEKAKFRYAEWLSGMPIYRLTLEEVRKCKDLVAESRRQMALFNRLVKSDGKLTEFMTGELTDLKKKWDT
jgi:DNA gyrase subunit A